MPSDTSLQENDLSTGSIETVSTEKAGNQENTDRSLTVYFCPIQLPFATESEKFSMQIRSEGEEEHPRKWNEKNVIVTVYVQPSASCWKTTATKGTERKSDWKPERPRGGYNRKEQLLAYSRQLRLSELKENQKSGRRWRLRSKKEKRHRASGSKLCGLFQRLVFPVGRRWSYEKIECDDQEKKSSKSNNWKRRLRKKLKVMSWTWRCRKV